MIEDLYVVDYLFYLNRWEETVVTKTIRSLAVGSGTISISTQASLKWFHTPTMCSIKITWYLLTKAGPQK